MLAIHDAPLDVPPPVSIVTVSYNQAAFIEDNIRSVIGQRYPAVEHIVVDGGSTDGTLDILRKYGGAVSWTSEKDRGQSEALNKGFRRASGQIIGWINSDDRLAPQALHKVASFFRQYPDALALVGDLDVIDEHGTRLKTFRGRRYDHEYLLNDSKGILQPSTFFRRRVFESVGYIDESLHYSMDYEFFLRITQHAPIEYLPDTLAAFRIHGASKTSSGSYRFSRERMRIRRKYGGKLLSTAGRTAVYIILTEPFRRIGWLRNLVNRCRKPQEDALP